MHRMPASTSPIGSHGRVTATGAIRPGKVGEVMVAIRGGVEAFLARDADGGGIGPYGGRGDGAVRGGGGRRLRAAAHRRSHQAVRHRGVFMDAVTIAVIAAVVGIP